MYAVAAALDVPAALVSVLCPNEALSPGSLLERLPDLTDALGCQVGDLFGGDQERRLLPPQAPSDGAIHRKVSDVASNVHTMTSYFTFPVQVHLRYAGRRKKPPPERSRSALVTKAVEAYAGGGWLIESGEHLRSRRRAIATYSAVMCVTTVCGVWLYLHPGPLAVATMGIVPLFVIAMLSGVAALASFVADKGSAKFAERVVKLVRRVSTVVDIAGALLVAACAASGIALSLLAAHYDRSYDTKLIRVEAFSFAYLALGMIGMVNAGMTPLFSIMKGRQLPLAHAVIALPRILVTVAVYTTGAELIAHGTTGWAPMTIAVTVASVGWELALRPSRRQAVDDVEEAATAVQAAARRADSDLPSALVALEGACLRRLFGGRRVIESEIGLIVRACIEQAEPWEQLPLRHNSVLAKMRSEMCFWDDYRFREEVGRFATAIRQSVRLHEPM